MWKLKNNYTPPIHFQLNLITNAERVNSLYVTAGMQQLMNTWSRAAEEEFSIDWILGSAQRNICLNDNMLNIWIRGSEGIEWWYVS